MDEKALYHLDQVGIRIVKERELFSEKPIENPEAAIQVVADALQDYDRELFCVVNLQSDMRPINMNIVSMGVLNQALVHPREVLKSAIELINEPFIKSQLQNKLIYIREQFANRLSDSDERKQKYKKLLEELRKFEENDSSKLP